MDVMHFLTFASEAEIVGLWGITFLLLALVALLGERRRMKRARFDGIGWVPWTPLFLTFAVVGGGLLVLSVKGIIAG